MTKKMLSLAFALVLITGFVAMASAEQGSTAYSGKKYYEQGVFVDMWNAGARTIPANSLVVLAATGTIGDSAGAVIDETSTANDTAVIGVTDNDIAAGGVGRVCVRGPHLVKVLDPVGTAQSSFTAGTVLSASASIGIARQYLTSNTSIGASGVLGFVMTSSTAGSSAAYNNSAIWAWIQPQRV